MEKQPARIFYQAGCFFLDRQGHSFYSIGANYTYDKHTCLWLVNRRPDTREGDASCQEVVEGVAQVEVGEVPVVGWVKERAAVKAAGWEALRRPALVVSVSVLLADIVSPM